MPEYLSPGVYIEEIELGPKPIEGVSTSTAGMVGVTERGPKDVPVLVTSFPEYQRLFGGYLDPRDFPNTSPNNVSYLPHATEGFFQNGGQRLFVVRVISADARKAQVDLMTPENPTAYASALVLRAQAGDTNLVVEDGTGLAAGNSLQIADGASTEYVKLGATPFPTLANRLLALRAPVPVGYSSGASVTPLPAIATAGGTALFNTTVSGGEPAGATRIRLAALPGAGIDPLARGNLLRVRGATTDQDEFAIVETPPIGADPTVILRHRLAFAHANGAAIDRMDEGAAGASETLAQGTGSGGSLLVMSADTAITAGAIVRLGGTPLTDSAAAYDVVTQFRAIRLQPAALHDHSALEPVIPLTLTPTGGGGAISNTLSAAATAGSARIHLTSPGAWAASYWALIDGGNPNAEFVQIAAVPDPAGSADWVDVRQGLRFDHAAGATIRRQTAAPGTATTLLQHLPAGRDFVLLASNTAAFDPNVVAQIGVDADPNREYHVLGALLAPALLPLDPGSPPLVPPVAMLNGHGPGALVELRTSLFTVQALDEGAWGNQLRVVVEPEEPALVQTAAAPAAPNSDVTLGSNSGVEPGSLLELLDVSTQLAAAATAGDTQIQVGSIAGFAAGDRIRFGRGVPEYAQIVSPPAGTRLTLTQPLRGNHDAGAWVDRMDATGLPRMAKVAQRVGANQVRFDGGGLPFAITGHWTVRSREFKLSVLWVKSGRANVRTPGDERVQEAETHRYLTLDDRHSRYIGKIIGSTTNPPRIWDRRPEGESVYLRVTDLVTALQSETLLRTGPDLVYETLPSGRRRAVGLRLRGGIDAVATIDDATYLGVDNVDPLLRTGLFSLKNEEEIGLVALPGRVSQPAQDALITHCELMRYRFAVMDSEPGDRSDGARLPDIQFQRQQFDSKYAAIYYPWLRLRNPFPDNPSQPNDVSIPPSGHVLGIYARSDVTRGVHKAPANEVITGITGLQRALTKGEQDILNPFPMNINVLRDFREQNRGNRVWGARVITSDPEWKYVNVRRLFIYIERSLELGLQWVVFEPNDYDLWARVRRSVSNFLTSVWRSGGLMGQTAEEAYFVRCDRTTMTQADIDNGRLIIVIGIAPVKPAEFVVIRIGQWQGGSSVEEGLA